MKLRQIMLIPLIALVICGPVLSAQAQDDPPPPQYDEMDDDFIDALVMMSVNHDLLAGKNELGELNALNDIVKGYYNHRLSSALLDDDQRNTLTKMKDDHLSAIDKRRNKVLMNADRELFAVILSILTNSKLQTGWVAADDEAAHKTAEAMPDPENDDDKLSAWANAMQSKILTSAGDTANMFLGIDTISAMPSLAPAINDSSDWSYNVPAITNSAGAISPTGNPGSSTEGNGSPLSPGDSAPPVNPSDNNSDAQDEPRLKPIRFDNNGFEPVTVVVESYEPAPGLSTYVPNASTVVNPESNSSAYLNLPLGTYTFCYYWQLDEDYNNDDYFDYHHRSTGAYTLNINSTDNVTGATTVTLSPDSNVSNPNGKCGEVIATDNSNLTPEEQANQGTHTYSSVCYGNEWCDQEVDFIVIEITFSSGALTMEAEGDSFELVHAGTNTYNSQVDDEYGTIYTYVFSTEGFTITANTIEGKLVFTSQD